MGCGIQFEEKDGGSKEEESLEKSMAIAMTTTRHTDRVLFDLKIKWLESDLRSCVRHLGLGGMDPGWIPRPRQRLGIEGHEL